MTLTRDELRSEIASLLADIKARRQVLADHHTLWGELLDADLEAQGYLVAMMDYGDALVCPVPAHRPRWKYIGIAHNHIFRRACLQRRQFQPQLLPASLALA